MKTKNFWVALGAVLVFAVLVNCAFSQPTQTREQILNLIPEEWKAKDPEAMNSLAQQILDDFVELSGNFAEGKIEKVKNKYTKLSGLYMDKGYNVVFSKDEPKHREFWVDKQARGNRLKLTTVRISISDTLGPQEGLVIEEGQVPEYKTFNYVAFVVHEISIETEGAKSGSAYDPPGIIVYAHQDNCTWKGRDGGR